ncbi:MAG: hypothetical protein ACXQS4_00665 [Methermicoccaceae archaeon]
MIPLLALKEGAQVAQKGLSKLVAKVGKKPLIAAGAGYGAGVLTSGKAEGVAKGASGLVWALVALGAVVVLYMVLKR